MIEYEVGSIPSRNLTLVVRDELDNPINVVGYDNYRIELRGTDDEEVDLKGVILTEIPNALGAFVVSWPKNRVVFNKKGKYLLRLVLEKEDGSRDITRTAEIRVREFGRLR
jgi:hypothetical protein